MGTASETSAIIRTERGLSIASTRITPYDVMEYLIEGWPPKLIRDWLNLTDEQIASALAYIDAHRSEVEQAGDDRRRATSRMMGRKEVRMEQTSTPVVEIERVPGRLGGAPTLKGTRMGVHHIVGSVELYDGNVERVVDDFPWLTVEVVRAVLAWYADHREEIDEIRRRNREALEQLLAEQCDGAEAPPG
jgi:uncharacterized protein (DUF433 family)